MEVPEGKLSKLHSDSLWSITASMGPLEIMKSCVINKKFHKICGDPRFWKWKIEKDFPDIDVDKILHLEFPQNYYYKLSLNRESNKVDELERDLHTDPKIMALEAEIRDLETEIQKRRRQIATIEQDYRREIEDANRVIKILTGKLNISKFKGATEYIRDNHLADLIYNNVLPRGGEIDLLKKYIMVKAKSDMVLILEYKGEPIYFIWIYEEGKRYQISQLPNLPLLFRTTANTLGLTPAALLERYEIDPEVLREWGNFDDSE